MTHPVSTIAEGSTINEAAEKMLAIKTRHLVVVDNSGLLMGLLGEHALLRTLNETLLDAKLGNERAYLRALFDAIPDPVWLKNPDGVYPACNMRLGQYPAPRPSCRASTRYWLNRPSWVRCEDRRCLP